MTNLLFRKEDIMNTRVCELSGIEYPVIQGGMAWVATAELAAAVSNAGGLGLIAAGNAPAEIVREQIKKARALTDKPFGVNVMMMSPYAEEVMNMLVEEKPAVVATGAGNPAKYIPALKEAGVKVIPVVASVAVAVKMERSGADAVVAEGTEAGGHIGELTTMVLVPQIAEAVSIPVIAAGGISDSRGTAAAFALGAEGIQVGTRFICSDECIAHDNYKQAVIKAKDRDAVVTGRSTGAPVRALKNKLTKEYQRLEKENAPFEEIEALGIGGLRRAFEEGDVEMGSLMAGQSAAMVHDIKPCAEIVRDLFSGVNDIVGEISSKLK
jgi:enoyl-[acyl-carrier protein] reductase II